MWEVSYKKAECQRTDAFELWCWRRLLRVSWTWSRSNQSILKEINHEYSLEGLMLKLKLQYFGQLMHSADSLEKDPDEKKGKEWGQEEKGVTEDEMVGWHHWLNGHEFEQTLGDSEGQGSLACCSPWHPKELNHNNKFSVMVFSPFLCLSQWAHKEEAGIPAECSRFPGRFAWAFYLGFWLFGPRVSVMCSETRL